MRARDALEEIVNTVPGLFPVIEELRLFGSYANGTNGALSDLDILVLTGETLRDRRLRAAIREEIDGIASKYRLETDIVFYTYDVLKTDDSRFTGELKKSVRLFRR